MNKDLLKGLIRASGKTQANISAELGISLSRFNAKINETGGAEFSLREAKKLISILGLSAQQFEQIFLP